MPGTVLGFDLASWDTVAYAEELNFSGDAACPMEFRPALLGWSIQDSEFVVVEMYAGEHLT